MCRAYPTVVERDAASPRSSVSSKQPSVVEPTVRGIAGGHGHAVGATIATVALQ
jgi:hypothetical protein